MHITPSPLTLRLAYSPDADDAFMFRAAIEGLIDTDGLAFMPVTADTQSLNELADSGDVDVSAISVAAWPSLADRFVLLPHGGSVGMRYGPVIVSLRPATIDDLPAMRLATPGERTTAHMIARLISPDSSMVTVPISPYEAIFEAIEQGRVDAGIIIHEGRLTYERRGLHRIVDIGEWWWNKTALPLPLGANVIRRSLGHDVVVRASRVLQRSIRWALDNRQEMIKFLIDHVDRPDEVATPELLDRYLNMYANEETYQYSQESFQAFNVLYDMAYRNGLLTAPVAAEFVP